MSPEFNYQARRKNGDLVGGELNAGGRDEVAKQLRERGMYVVAIEEKGAEKTGGLFGNVDLEELKFWEHGFSIAELAYFSQQFSVLIAAGIPLVGSLGIMKDQVDKKHVKEMIGEVISDVEAGETLTEAFKKHPDYFPSLFIHLIKAGETGGVLDEVLAELVEYYRRRDKINKEVKSALYYPAAVLSVGLIAVLVLIGFVLPEITNMLIGLGGDLPLPTVILIGVTNFVNSYWWIMLIGIILLVLGIRSYSNTPKGKRNIDKLVLKVPVVGDLIMKITISRFASTLALLMKSGVNIMNALPVLEDVVGNEVYADILIETRARVREGINMSQPLAQSEEFPPMVIQMIKVGEETGNMEEMLNRLSDFYDVEVEAAIDGSISLIEPLLIVLLAIVVGGIVASVLLPLFGVYTAI